MSCCRLMRILFPFGTTSKTGGYTMSFFKDLKEDIAQSVNELTESLDENLNPDSNEQDVEVKADFMQNLTEEDVTDVPVEDLMDLQMYGARYSRPHSQSSLDWFLHIC